MGSRAREGIKVQEVEVELMPAEALPAYTLPGEGDRSSRWTDSEASPKKQEEQLGEEVASGTDSPARVADLELRLQSDKAGAEDSLLNPSDTGFSQNSPPPLSRSISDGDQHSTLRMGWLLTHVLKEAPLVHPRHAIYAPYNGPSASSSEEDRRALGWETIKLEMFTDANRPEVGFAELGPETRVAAAGETFRGGIDNPGEKLQRKEGGKKNKNVIAGL